MPETYWLIRGYDGAKLLFEKRVNCGQITTDQVKDLLKALAAQTLNVDEIIGAYARRRTKIANDLLNVSPTRATQMYTCGTNPHFVASIEGERRPHPWERENEVAPNIAQHNS